MGGPRTGLRKRHLARRCVELMVGPNTPIQSSTTSLWGSQTHVTRLKSSLARAALIVLAPLIVAGCGINTIPPKEEAAKAQWAEVQNQYQVAAALVLVLHLVNTVKGYAA